MEIRSKIKRKKLRSTSIKGDKYIAEHMQEHEKFLVKIDIKSVK